MSGEIKRREFLQRSVIGGIGASWLMLGNPINTPASPVRTPPGSHEPFKGIFPIMQTPFRDDNDEIDQDAMAKQVNFVINAGGGGMVWPQLGSEFYVLTDEERMKTTEMIVKEARGRLPVIIGVQSTNYWKASIKLAKHAESIGADGIISLPPFTGNATVDFAAEYYRSLARAVPLPIFVQNSGGRFGPAMPTDTIIELAKEYPSIAYIKEEAHPVTHRIGAMAEKGKGILRGVFSGAWGTTLLNELQRGCRETIPSAAIVDVYATIFDSFLAGDQKKAQEIFDKVISFVTFKRMFALELEKEILKRRGIFKNNRMRVSPYKLVWDKVDQEEFEVLFNNLKPYFRV